MLKWTRRMRVSIYRPAKLARNWSHVVASVRHFGYSRSSGLEPGRVYFDDVTVFRWHRFLRPHYKTAFSKSIVFNRPRSIYQYSNMVPRLSGQTSIFGVVFSVSKSLLGIEGQRKLEKFAILTRKPRSHARILIYRTWPIRSTLESVLEWLRFRWLFSAL